MRVRIKIKRILTGKIIKIAFGSQNRNKFTNSNRIKIKRYTLIQKFFRRKIMSYKK